MSTDISTIKNTGNAASDLQITQFLGNKGSMLQLTQGFGLLINADEPSFIQLSYEDTYKLIIELTKWLQNQSKHKANTINKVIQELKGQERSILNDMGECERFIEDLVLLELPITLLKNS